MSASKIVGWKNAFGSRPGGKVGDLRAAAQELGALVETELHVALGRVDLARRDERALVGVHVHVVADDDLARALHEHADELVVDLARHECARSRLAHLAVVEERAPQHAGGREVEVGVVEHDVGRLAAELERDLLHRARRELHDAPPDFGRAGERDLVDERVLRELLARAAAGTGDEVDDAGRDVGLFARLHQLDRRQRREARGLQHRAVAGRDRGCDLPAGHEEREVPRHDAGAHAVGLAAHDALRGRERALAAVDHVGLVLRATGEVLERGRATRHVGEHRLLDRAAAVARFDLGDLPRARGDELGDLAQLLRAFLARHLRPRAVVERVARGFDRALRVFAAGLGDVGDLLARRRCEGRERLARLRVGPLTVDEELGVGHGRSPSLLPESSAGYDPFEPSCQGQNDDATSRFRADHPGGSRPTSGPVPVTLPSALSFTRCACTWWPAMSSRPSGVST